MNDWSSREGSLQEETMMSMMSLLFFIVMAFMYMYCVRPRTICSSVLPNRCKDAVEPTHQEWNKAQARLHMHLICQISDFPGTCSC